MLNLSFAIFCFICKFFKTPLNMNFFNLKKKKNFILFKSLSKIALFNFQVTLGDLTPQTLKCAMDFWVI